MCAGLFGLMLTVLILLYSDRIIVRRYDNRWRCCCSCVCFAVPLCSSVVFVAVCGVDEVVPIVCSYI